MLRRPDGSENSASHDTDEHEPVYRDAMRDVPLICAAHAIALLHEWAGNGAAVVKYGELAEDIYADRRYKVDPKHTRFEYLKYSRERLQSRDRRCIHAFSRRRRTS